ncbi:hypothetical protein OK016_14175 [Vibrio chagasii]|nr:hypothetical protein [Vibrio chagasii]
MDDNGDAIVADEKSIKLMMLWPIKWAKTDANVMALGPSGSW